MQLPCQIRMSFNDTQFNDVSLSDQTKKVNSCIVIKLKSALSKLILPTFKTSDDTVLQKLYDQLCLSTNQGYISQGHLLEIMIPWLSHTVNQWSYITDGVKGFVLRIIGYIAKVPEGFSLLKSNNILSVLCLIKNNLKDQNNSIILGYIDIIYNLLNHDGGIQLIIVGEMWKEIVQFSLKNQSMYVRKRSNQLISTFITKLSSNNIYLVHQIMTDALQFEKSTNPLLNAYEIQNPSTIEESNDNHNSLDYKHNKLNLYRLISEILIEMLNSGYSKVIKELFEQYQIQDIAWTEIHNCYDIDIILAASKLICLWSISTIGYSQNNANKLSTVALSSLIMKQLNLLITRHLFPKVILETCVEYSSLWYKYSDKFDKEEISGDFKMENLIFLIQAFPILICIHARSEKNEITELFVDKLFKVACPSLVRLCYFYRDHLRTSQLSLERITCQVINSFIRISSFCKKEQAVMILQALLHLLKDFADPVGINECQNNEICQNNLIKSYPELLSVLLNGLTCYLTKFKFSWRDSLETVGMMCFIQGLITNPDIPFLVCAEALKLAKLVLLHFIPPNLALLVDTLQGSSMRDLGNQLFKTLGSMHWEVRDSSLEVLQVIGCLAEDKFPAFQALLLEHDLPNIIVSIVESDSEPYVRSSALSCLRELVKVKVIWDTYLQKEQNLTLFLSLLYFETEGIVRHNATLLIKEIFKYRTLSEDKLELVYDTLYHVAQNDLHWEVKISALDFWDSVRDKCFISVGMVDGNFPEVIFSKEKKKIVQMTPTEMSNRVMDALNQLSKNGCLQTLWETLHDECDSEVQRKSAQTIKNLLDIVTSFGIFNNLKEENFINNGESNAEGFNYSLNSVESEITNVNIGLTGVSLDDIIDEIIAETDLKLLSGLVQLAEPVRNWPKINRIALSPTEFLLRIRSLDFNNFLKTPSEISKLSMDFESLLDDILLYSRNNTGVDPDNNSIDCY